MPMKVAPSSPWPAMAMWSIAYIAKQTRPVADQDIPKPISKFPDIDLAEIAE